VSSSNWLLDAEIAPTAGHEITAFQRLSWLMVDSRGGGTDGVIGLLARWSWSKLLVIKPMP